MIRISRRDLFALTAGFTATLAVPARARAVPATVRAPDAPPLLAAARAAMERHAQHIRHTNQLVIADFSLPSHRPRLSLVDLAGGKVRTLLVTHGRGSDPKHSGWVERFSNVPGSNASSDGAYVAGPEYFGKHGRSQRLVGLDPTNNNAEARAIVVHAAWYAGPDMIEKHGKLGRSEGCFAVSEADLSQFMAILQPGTLLFAGKA
ncbi:MAG: murein L,D-transpeptidase catalytic domain family protein [Sphingomonadaceae bacterium]